MPIYSIIFFFFLQKLKLLKRANGCELPAFHNTLRCTKVSRTLTKHKCLQIFTCASTKCDVRVRGECYRIDNSSVQMNIHFHEYESILDAKQIRICVSSCENTSKFQSTLSTLFGTILLKICVMSKFWNFNFSRFFMCLRHAHFA